MEAKTRYCWLNINNGEFSNSWSEEDQQKYGPKLDLPIADGWKLIKFECINDTDFEFTNHMKLR